MPAISDLHFGERESLLLFLSADCRFCQASAAFYRNLMLASRERDVPFGMYAITSDATTKFREYTRREGLVFDRVFPEAPPIPGFPVVPIIAVVNRQGRVERRWVGQLTVDEERDVMNTLGLREPTETHGTDGRDDRVSGARP